MAPNPNIKTARAWALVRKNGRIHVDTCCKTRTEAQELMSKADDIEGTKVRRVTVVVVMK